MSGSNGTGRRGESERGDRESGSLRGLPADIRKGWRDFKDVLQRAIGLIETAGDLALDVYKLGSRALRFAARHGGRVAAAAALIGISSPLTDGWGVEALSSSPWATWAPVALLPIGALGLRAILVSFGPIDREGDREQKRLSEEQREPGVQGRLDHDAQRRRHANTTIKTHGGEPLLEDHSFTPEIVDEAAYHLSVRGQATTTLTLRRWTKRHGLKEVATRGTLDDVVRGRLEGLQWEEMVNFDHAVAAALEPLEYFHAAVAFSAGPHHYLLIGIGGSVIPDHVMLEISHAATRLVERLAYGIEAARISRSRA